MMMLLGLKILINANWLGKCLASSKHLVTISSHYVLLLLLLVVVVSTIIIIINNAKGSQDGMTDLRLTSSILHSHFCSLPLYCIFCFVFDLILLVVDPKFEGRYFQF